MESELSEESLDASKSPEDRQFASIVDAYQAGCKLRCPDVFVGRIADIEQGGTSDGGIWQIAASRTPCRRPPDPCLILIMESPHVDEFDKRKGSYVPWPANGATGRAIQRFASALADGADVDSATTGLILFNAIPYQCSLGRRTGEPPKQWKGRRDEVFTEIWDSWGKQLFEARLNHWHRSGDLIVNACTRGAGTVPLRDRVERAIEAIPFANLGKRLRRRHPSAWLSKHHANLTWQPQYWKLER